MWVDPPDVVPYGPRRVAAKGQISVPGQLLDLIGVAIGEDVWLVANPDRPGTLVVMPRTAMRELFEKGWTSVG